MLPDDELDALLQKLEARPVPAQWRTLSAKNFALLDHLSAARPWWIGLQLDDPTRGEAWRALLDARALRLLACEYAERALPMYLPLYGAERRPLRAHAVARGYARGQEKITALRQARAEAKAFIEEDPGFRPFLFIHKDAALALIACTEHKAEDAARRAAQFVRSALGRQTLAAHAHEGRVEAFAAARQVDSAERDWQGARLLAHIRGQP